MLSDRALNIQESKTIYISNKINEFRAQGKDVISLGAGQPDFPVPQEIINATQKALNEKKYSYSTVSGEIQLRELIAKNFSTETKVNYSANEIIVSSGSKNSLFNIFQLLLNLGDEAIVLSPYWVSFPESIKLAGGIPVIAECGKDSQPNIDIIKASISPKTKLIIINSPNNPTGQVYEKEFLVELYKLAKKENFYIISDEAYCDYIYDTNKFASFVQAVPESKDKVITIRSFSKSYAMTGFRIGITYAPQKIVEALTCFQGHSLGNIAPFIQYGAIEALKIEKNFIPTIRELALKRMKLAYKLFSPIFPGSKPTGGIYYYGKTKSNSLQLTEMLLEKANVAMMPAEFFGGKNGVRICFMLNESRMREAAERIKGLV